VKVVALDLRPLQAGHVEEKIVPDNLMLKVAASIVLGLVEVENKRGWQEARVA